MSEQEVQHPSRFLDPGTINALRTVGLESERSKKLHASQLEVIRREKWFKMFVPVRYGGLGWPLPDILKVEEALSYADGSTGWVVTLCSGAGWFIGFVNEAIAQAFFGGDDICIAGSGAITGMAEITDKGYVVNGAWKYASGAHHATAFTANCYVTRRGVRVVNDDGSDKVLTFIFKDTEVAVCDTWRSMGMIATGSHSFEVNDLHVTHDRCFDVDPSTAVLNDPVYRFPFLQLAQSTLAANLAGMTLRFVELADLMTKSRTVNYRVFDESRNLNAARRRFSEAIDRIWSKGVTEDLANEVSDASMHLVQTCRRTVERLYPDCGLAAADYDSEINRVWRNFHTASLHSLFRSQ